MADQYIMLLRCDRDQNPIFSLSAITIWMSPCNRIHRQGSSAGYFGAIDKAAQSYADATSDNSFLRMANRMSTSSSGDAGNPSVNYNLPNGLVCILHAQLPEHELRRQDTSSWARRCTGSRDLVSSKYVPFVNQSTIIKWRGLSCPIQ